MKMKTFKRFSAAIKHAAGRPIVKVGDTYLVAHTTDMLSLGMVEVGLLNSSKTGGHSYNGHVTLKHLDRLGNANWATPREGQQRWNPINWEEAK